MLDLHFGTDQLILWSILHYATSCCQTDGEWLSIILSFLDTQLLSWTALFFAYEDKEGANSFVTGGNHQVIISSCYWVWWIPKEIMEKSFCLDDRLCKQKPENRKWCPSIFWVNIKANSCSLQVTHSGKVRYLQLGGSNKFWDKSQSAYCVGKY